MRTKQELDAWEQKHPWYSEHPRVPWWSRLTRWLISAIPFMLLGAVVVLLGWVNGGSWQGWLTLLVGVLLGHVMAAWHDAHKEQHR